MADLARAFAREGHRLYLVGGVVRDLALGVHAPVDDIDLTTDAEPAVIKRLVQPRATALWTQGERFGTIGCTINGRDLEITTHRAEAYDHGSRNPVVAFGTSVDDDLVRRDFTINAMAVSLPDGHLVDPFGGLADLRDRRLATPLTATESFSDDPLRMLRAARFVPRFDLTIDPELERAATALASRLAIVAVERIRGEVERLLALPRPAAGLDFLSRTGLLGRVVPPYADGIDARERAVALAAAAGHHEARRAGLLVPLGADRARTELARLRYSRADVRRTTDLVRSLPAVQVPDPAPVDVRRLLASIGVDAIGPLRDLDRADRPDEPESPFFAVHDRLADAEDLTDLASPLSGGEVMAHLGLGPGPLVGRATGHLRRLRIEQGPLTEDGARAALDRWWADHRSEASPPST